jgi:hypothetical protein
VLAERFAGSGGTVRWTNFLVVGGRMIGIHVENSDETTLTRYFHTDHLGSIAVITSEAAAVVERLSCDAWGLRQHPDGTPDPSGSIASQSSRGFTGHEHLAEVGLIHMNGRVVACPRVGEAEPEGPAARPLRHARPDDGEPVLHARVEPLQLRRQLPPQLHRPLRLLLPGLLLEADLQGDREVLAKLGGDRADRGDGDLHPCRPRTSLWCRRQRRCYRHHQR